MIFKVPKKFKGSYVLTTLQRVLAAGQTVSICGNDLYAADVKAAIENGSLIPVGEKYIAKEGSDTAILMNKTGKLLILGDISLRPGGGIPVNKEKIASSMPIQGAKRDGLVEIVSDDGFEEPSPKPKKSAKKKKVEENVQIVEIKEETEEEPKMGGDKDVTPTVWDFKTKKLKEAEVVPKTPNPFINIDEEETKAEDAEFIDDKSKTTKKKKKRKTKKKVKKKKAVKKTIKKKGKTSKKKKVKTIEPVGEVKPEKTEADVAIELDSRGNPVDKPSDTLQHLIDSLGEPEDVEFVDKEQAQERLRKRTDM